MTGSRGISPTEQSPVAQPARARQSRRYGFACCNCRHRKVKCDGVLPACGKCVLSREQCTYNKRPSLAYAVNLQHQLKAYQERFEQLRTAKDGDRDALLEKPVTTGPLQGCSTSDFSPPPVVESATHGSDEDSSSLQEETSIGTDGQLCFYGSTSLYHISPSDGHRSSTLYSKGRETGAPHARLEQQDAMTAFLAKIPSSLLDNLLYTYWCWPHHLHCVLIKKIFIRDLENLGPFVTPFLLSAVLTQAARYSTRSDAAEVGRHFAKQARKLLDLDIDRGSSIATIQGLLIFSARECACGRTSQGWLYSGMAFRMARDLGLHLAPKKLSPLCPHFSDEDLAVRNQIFWSCYTWDKTISLCLGRTPAITNVIELPRPDTLLDGLDADEEIWEPKAFQGSLFGGLMQHRAFSSSRFVAYCELCVITHDVLDKLYVHRHRMEKDQSMARYLDQTLEKLDEWCVRLPRDLLVQDDSKSMECPPLHILLLNLVYQTVVILLCRPYRVSSETAKARCTRAAQMTDSLFMLHVRRFGFRCVTWLQTYTMFVACTINVKDLKENREQDNTMSNADLARATSARLDFGLEILRQGGKSTPSAGRCAAIVAQLLSNAGSTCVNTRHVSQQGAEILESDLQNDEWQLEITSLDPQPQRETTQADKTLATVPNVPFNKQHAGTESRTASDLMHPGGNVQGQSPEVPNSGSMLDGSITTFDVGIQSPLVSTLFGGASENLWEGGSWTLTDTEFDLNMAFNNTD
ncbi:fungal-specific transcription factor domain-containing protein [Xylaria bambusicola]|uniref:fungal-specific transcription factor domain-containing protein n=1 Tax=Xylaria bambusicola TaxID=326684 RepID=UPI00200790C9|nr:fungal-specific transcription factor domain-containing protein [Xylaria bambusicola]KAI0520982.1 fungal-specific transcription factor domain-containing protein [Xylaria bambusicola]